MTIIMVHDAGCRFARESDGGHSDASRRLSDAYNTHHSVGIARGWIAVALSDGRSHDAHTVYESRGDAIAHQNHNEDRFAYINLAGAPAMSVCEAAAMLRWHRVMGRIQRPELGARDGGLVVIPRLTREGVARQLAAMAGHSNVPLALGRAKT